MPSTQLEADLAALPASTDPEHVAFLVAEQANTELPRELAKLFVRAFREVLDWPDWFVGMLAAVAVKADLDEFTPPEFGSTWESYTLMCMLEQDADPESPELLARIEQLDRATATPS